MPVLSKELKDAILAMPAAEKDKLLLRLVAKDDDLCKKLEYKLLDEESSLEERREEIRKVIASLSKASHYSPGYLMMDMRSVNSLITQHVKITKDKYGEVELTLLMLNEVLSHQMGFIEKYKGRADTFAAYVAKRTQFALEKAGKLHPDFYIEFEENINTLLKYIYTCSPAAYYAREMKLPKI
jgi:hypothetical protein